MHLEISRELGGVTLKFPKEWTKKYIVNANTVN